MEWSRVVLGMEQFKLWNEAGQSLEWSRESLEWSRVNLGMGQGNAWNGARYCLEVIMGFSTWFLRPNKTQSLMQSLLRGGLLAQVAHWEMGGPRQDSFLKHQRKQLPCRLIVYCSS